MGISLGVRFGSLSNPWPPPWDVTLDVTFLQEVVRGEINIRQCNVLSSPYTVSCKDVLTGYNCLIIKLNKECSLGMQMLLVEQGGHREH